MTLCWVWLHVCVVWVSRPRDGRQSWDVVMHDAGLRRVDTEWGNKFYRYADPKLRSK